MKIVLDGVFNHTSVNHPWFDCFNKRDDGLGAWQNPVHPIVISINSMVTLKTILAGMVTKAAGTKLP